MWSVSYRQCSSVNQTACIVLFVYQMLADYVVSVLQAMFICQPDGLHCAVCVSDVGRLCGQCLTGNVHLSARRPALCCLCIRCWLTMWSVSYRQCSSVNQTACIVLFVYQMLADYVVSVLQAMFICQPDGLHCAVCVSDVGRLCGQCLTGNVHLSTRRPALCCLCIRCWLTMWSVSYRQCSSVSQTACIVLFVYQMLADYVVSVLQAMFICQPDGLHCAVCVSDVG